MSSETSQIYTLPTFKRKEGLTQKEINVLEKRGALKIQQGGFHGHNLKHRKNVVMLDSQSIKQANPATTEYINREDKRRRRKESFLRSKEGDFHKIEVPDVHGKDHHIEFRISPRAGSVLRDTARLFKISPNQYVKAVLYLNLGMIYEPMDRRKKE